MSALTDQIDIQVAAAIPQIITLQADYATVGRGRRFFQGIKTPPIIPADGATRTPDFSLRPSYQPEDWTAFGIGAVVIGNTRFSFEIHQYNSPLGRGWLLITWVIQSGVTWSRTYNVQGPETYRESAWAPVPISPF